MRGESKNEVAKKREGKIERDGGAEASRKKSKMETGAAKLECKDGGGRLKMNVERVEIECKVKANGKGKDRVGNCY